MWATQTDDRYDWHVVIYRRGDKYSLHRKKGEKNIDLTPYVLEQNI